ncbi:ThiF family adenylyltransferase [Bacillus phage vB_BauM_KLEB27-3]|nr:ThiF family adenylyltransferase [Bacillus phage vB_BauM_KLEB27-3]
MELSFTPTYQLSTFPKMSKHFIIIGSGGNGGYIIPNLFRQISLQNQKAGSKLFESNPAHYVTVIDGDEVETKNISRQNFLASDVGKNKAQVLGMRYARAFGIDINIVDSYLTEEKMLYDIAKSVPNSIPVFVGAVDNNKTRKIIHDVYQRIENSFWVDAGNEEYAGQVVLGHNSKNYLTKDTKSGAPISFRTPCIAEMFPEVLDGTDKLPTEESCAERAVSNPQNIHTNITAGTLMFGYLNSILTLKDEGISSHCVTFNSKLHNFSTKFNKFETLSEEVLNPVSENEEELTTTEA